MVRVLPSERFLPNTPTGAPLPEGRSELPPVIRRAEVVAFALVALLIICVVAVLWAAKAFFLPVVMAFVVGTMLSPVANLLEHYRIPRALGAVLIVTTVGAGAALMVGLISSPLMEWSTRLPELASRLLVFEIDRPSAQAWKRQRLVDLGLASFLRLVPVDFEAGDAWWERLAASGFDSGRPAVVASTGVSMYLTQDAIAATLRQVAALAPGSTLAMSFMLPIELADPEVRPGIERAAAGARANGTPFISFFTPTEMLTLARDAGFREVQHVSAATLAQRYFAGRTDGLRPPNNSEELLVATT